MNVSNPIHIRAHHLLCLQGFQGKGYDSAFVANMSDIALRLQKEAALKFKIVDDTDEICAPCPHRDVRTCAKAPDADRCIRNIDSIILKKTGLSVGQIQNAKKSFQLVNTIFQAKDDIEKICGPCAWRGDCLWYSGRLS